MQFSYNKLRTFGECTLKYRLAYVERLPRPPVRSLAFERRLHATLCEFHRFARRDGIVREEDLLGAFSRICDTTRHPEVKEEAWYQEGEEILRRYCEVENSKQRVPAFLEESLKVPFGPYILTGKVDRIDFCESGSYSIIDYKLDRILPSENQAVKSEQLSFYHLLVAEGLGLKSEDVRLYYLRHGVEQVSTRTPKQMQEMVAWIDATAASVQKEKEWQPQEGSGCRTCAFQNVCPAKTGKKRKQGKVWRQTELSDLFVERASNDEA